MLLKKGADVTSKTSEGNTALGVAKGRGNTDIMRLLSQQDTSVNLPQSQITKEEFSSLWMESGAHAALLEVMSGRNVPVEEHFTTRVDYILSQCEKKWGITKLECINYLKQHERIKDNEFNELYRGKRNW